MNTVIPTERETNDEESQKCIDFLFYKFRLG